MADTPQPDPGTEAAEREAAQAVQRSLDRRGQGGY
jgi:hypothetical protein